MVRVLPKVCGLILHSRCWRAHRAEAGPALLKQSWSTVQIGRLETCSDLQCHQRACRLEAVEIVGSEYMCQVAAKGQARLQQEPLHDVLSLPPA